MNDEKNLKDIYYKVMNYEQKQHEQNQRRIRIGLRCIYIIPAFFLILLFLTNSSKIIFLVLWIVSLFGIAVYLVGTEYADYKIQEQMHELRGEQDKELESLIDLTPVEERMASAVERIEARGIEMMGIEPKGGKSE